MDSVESESQSESSQTSIKDEKDEVQENKPAPRRSTRKKLNKVRCSTDEIFKIFTKFYESLKQILSAYYKRQNDPNGFAKTNANGQNGNRFRWRSLPTEELSHAENYLGPADNFWWKWSETKKGSSDVKGEAKTRNSIPNRPIT